MSCSTINISRKNLETLANSAKAAVLNRRHQNDVRLLNQYLNRSRFVRFFIARPGAESASLSARLEYAKYVTLFGDEVLKLANDILHMLRVTDGEDVRISFSDLARLERWTAANTNNA